MADRGRVRVEKNAKRVRVLLGGDVVAVLHVVHLAQVGGDLAHLREELDVLLLLLTEQDGVLEKYK